MHGLEEIIFKHCGFLCSPFCGRAWRWAVLGELKAKGPQGDLRLPHDPGAKIPVSGCFNSGVAESVPGSVTDLKYVWQSRDQTRSSV
jgi:hypothetical protein